AYDTEPARDTAEHAVVLERREVRPHPLQHPPIHLARIRRAGQIDYDLVVPHRREGDEAGAEPAAGLDGHEPGAVRPALTRVERLRRAWVENRREPRPLV